MPAQAMPRPGVVPDPCLGKLVHSMGAESNGVPHERVVRQDSAHRTNGTGLPRKTSPLAPTPRVVAPEPPSSDIQAPDYQPPRTWRTAAKRGFDVVVAALLFLPAVLITGVAGLLVVLTSRGPLLYSQVRVGRGGRRFTLYKIRTMTHNCEHETGPRWASRFDTRITRVGHVLRRLHLDELPQLWNVLKGDMSLVGPRPERPEFMPLLAEAIPDYKERHALQPGMTGLAQVQLPPDTDVESVRRKLTYDLYYVRHVGFWLDLRILVSTAYYLVRVPFFRVPAWFRVPGKEQVEVAAGPGVNGTVRARAKAPDTHVVPDTTVTPRGLRAPR